MGADALKKAPENAKILAGTKMLEAGQSETIEMAVPDKPGKYEYVCTFPGHWQVMNGVITEELLFGSTGDMAATLVGVSGASSARAMRARAVRDRAVPTWASRTAARTPRFSRGS